MPQFYFYKFIFFHHVHKRLDSKENNFIYTFIGSLMTSWRIFFFPVHTLDSKDEKSLEDSVFIKWATLLATYIATEKQPKAFVGRSHLELIFIGSPNNVLKDHFESCVHKIFKMCIIWGIWGSEHAGQHTPVITYITCTNESKQFCRNIVNCLQMTPTTDHQLNQTHEDVYNTEGFLR